MAVRVAGWPNKRPATGNPHAHPHIRRRTPSFTKYHATLWNTITPEKSFALRTLENAAFTTGRPRLYLAFAGTMTSGMGGCAEHTKLAMTGIKETTSAYR